MFSFRQASTLEEYCTATAMGAQSKLVIDIVTTQITVIMLQGRFPLVLSVPQA